MLFRSGKSTEELAHYLERGRKGVERNRAALQALERKRRDGEGSVDDNVLAALERVLKRYEHAVSISTTVLGERRQ